MRRQTVYSHGNIHHLRIQNAIGSTTCSPSSRLVQFADIDLSLSVIVFYHLCASMKRCVCHLKDHMTCGGDLWSMSQYTKDTSTWWIVWWNGWRDEIHTSGKQYIKWPSSERTDIRNQAHHGSSQASVNSSDLRCALHDVIGRKHNGTVAFLSVRTWTWRHRTSTVKRQRSILWDYVANPVRAFWKIYEFAMGKLTCPELAEQ